MWKVLSLGFVFCHSFYSICLLLWNAKALVDLTTKEGFRSPPLRKAFGGEGMEHSAKAKTPDVSLLKRFSGALIQIFKGGLAPGVTPKTLRLPKHGETMLSVNGSPLGQFGKTPASVGMKRKNFWVRSINQWNVSVQKWWSIVCLAHNDLGSSVTSTIDLILAKRRRNVLIQFLPKGYVWLLIDWWQHFDLQEARRGQHEQVQGWHRRPKDLWGTFDVCLRTR